MFSNQDKKARSNVAKISMMLIRLKGLNQSQAMKKAWNTVRFADMYMASGYRSEDAYQKAWVGCLEEIKREKRRQAWSLKAA